MSPKISILMNCYNSAPFLKEALDSVYAQTYKDFEILFIDNHSTDESKSIAQSRDSRLRYLKTPEFMNLYEARAFGIQFVKGQYLCFLDCDDTWEEDKLKHQLEIFNSKKVDLVYGGFRLNFMTKTVLSFLKTRFSLLLNFFRWALKPSSIHSVEKVIENYDINLQTVMVRASSIKETTFNAKLNLLGDLDFFIRLGLSPGFRFCYDKKVVAHYRIHEDQLSQSKVANWAREGRYCSIWVYPKILNKGNLQNFRKHVEFFRSNDFWRKGNRRLALKIKRKNRFRNSTMFLDWVKHELRMYF